MYRLADLRVTLDAIGFPLILKFGSPRLESCCALALGETMSDSFDWTSARVDHMYPPDDVLAEIGRVGVAAARLDKQLTLALVGLHHSEPYDKLVKRNSSALCKMLEISISEFFEAELEQRSLRGLSLVRDCIEARHSIMHSIWSPEDRDALVSVSALNALASQQELNDLIRQRGISAEWRIFHPKTGSVGPKTIGELVAVRRDLEEAADWLEHLRFALASALFVGKPAGARKVLDPETMSARNQQG
jgi:hypothetical protein